MKEQQTYKFIREKSIVYGLQDDYWLSETEYAHLYSFFVTYSMCASQSAKIRSAVDYGWSSNVMNQSGLKRALETVLKLNKNEMFVFTDEDNLKEQFVKLDLADGALQHMECERAVIGKTNENNRYYKLFYRIRNCFAHGNFSLKFNSHNERMIVMQDNSQYNVTARLVLKLQTLLDFVAVVDRNGLLSITDNTELVKEAS